MNLVCVKCLAGIAPLAAVPAAVTILDGSALCYSHALAIVDAPEPDIKETQ